MNIIELISSFGCLVFGNNWIKLKNSYRFEWYVSRGYRMYKKAGEAAGTNKLEMIDHIHTHFH